MCMFSAAALFVCDCGSVRFWAQPARLCPPAHASNLPACLPTWLPACRVYLLMERNASTKVMTVLWQLVAEVQAAAPNMTYSVEVVDSLEDADLVLATRARLKNSPKVRCALS